MEGGGKREAEGQEGQDGPGPGEAGGQGERRAATADPPAMNDSACVLAASAAAVRLWKQQKILVPKKAAQVFRQPARGLSLNSIHKSQSGVSSSR